MNDLMKAEIRADGWHLGPDGEDVGPFLTKEAAEDFLDWFENQREN